MGNEELMDISVEVLKIKRIELPYDKVPPLGTYPKGSMSYQSVTCISIFTATLFPVAIKWNDSRYSSRERWILTL